MNDAATTTTTEDLPDDNTKWVCTVCGYVHTGFEPPYKCPKCGAHREKFQRQ